jgi:hypothetical protein
VIWESYFNNQTTTLINLVSVLHFKIERQNKKTRIYLFFRLIDLFSIKVMVHRQTTFLQKI